MAQRTGRKSPEEKFMMMLARGNKGTIEKPAHIESELQRSCKKWFDMQYPKLSRLCFAVPNGGARNAREAAIMKGEGVTAGVADMIILIPRKGYGCLCIEFKTKDGKQSASQKLWQADAEAHGNKYVVVRSIDEYVKEVKNYLAE
jgi:hypothetical protein